MSREIKFRVWDKKNKYMLYQEIIDVIDLYNEEIIMRTETEDGIRPDSKSFDDLVFMQYTGLKDKKDIEIYEGDIIIYKQTIKYICKWNKHGFGFGWYTFSTDEIGRIKTTWNYDLSDLDDTRIEVIGNIYEDKSLLKGSKDE